MSRGIQRERQVKALMEEEGFVVIRAAGSLGVCDLVALRETSFGDCEAMLIEVKSETYPFKHFGPAKRRAIIEAATEAGAEAWLVNWPKHRKEPAWVPAGQWPEAKVAA